MDAESGSPVLTAATATGALTRARPVIHDKPRMVGDIACLVRRYRPCIEGLIARIERWTNTANGGIHWRSITKRNRTDASRSVQRNCSSKHRDVAGCRLDRVAAVESRSRP